MASLDAERNHSFSLGGGWFRVLLFFFNTCGRWRCSPVVLKRERLRRGAGLGAAIPPFRVGRGETLHGDPTRA